ncbi:MAG: hypothetical protein ACRCZZ_08880 [Phocaeicola sp.]
MKTKNMKSVNEYRIPMNYFNTLAGYTSTNTEYKRLLSQYADFDWKDVDQEELRGLIKKEESMSFGTNAEVFFLKNVEKWLAAHGADASCIVAKPIANIDKIGSVQMKGQPLPPKNKKIFFTKFWKWNRR